MTRGAPDDLLAGTGVRCVEHAGESVVIYLDSGDDLTMPERLGRRLAARIWEACDRATPLPSVPGKGGRP